MNKVSKGLAAVVAVPVVLVLTASAALAAATPSSIVGGAASSLKDELLSVAGTVAPFAAIVGAVAIGWRFAKRALHM